MSSSLAQQIERLRAQLAATEKYQIVMTPAWAVGEPTAEELASPPVPRPSGGATAWINRTWFARWTGGSLIDWARDLEEMRHDAHWRESERPAAQKPEEVRPMRRRVGTLSCGRCGGSVTQEQPAGGESIVCPTAGGVRPGRLGPAGNPRTEEEGNGRLQDRR